VRAYLQVGGAGLARIKRIAAGALQRLGVADVAGADLKLPRAIHRRQRARQVPRHREHRDHARGRRRRRPKGAPTAADAAADAVRRHRPNLFAAGVLARLCLILPEFRRDSAAILLIQ